MISSVNNPASILKREMGSEAIKDRLGTVKHRTTKSLDKRKLEYEEASRRIFCEEVAMKKKKRNYEKIRKMRERKILKEFVGRLSRR